MIEQEKQLPIITMNAREVRISIPQCCREGWETCKHLVKKQKKVKTNIGL